MTQAPGDVYARQLFPKRYGIPLFIPEPYDNLPSEYRNQGASIGDVGTITQDGSFSFVFNICKPSDDPVNCNGVPAGFKQVSLLQGEISYLHNMHAPGSDVSSASVQKECLTVEGTLSAAELLNVPASFSAGYSFTSASSEAAILTLPEGASRQDLLCINKFRRHAIENVMHWYEFVNGVLGREAPNGSLYLVTGCDKSTTWGIASVARVTETNALSLKFTAARLIEANAEYTYSWETYCPATVRIGPDLHSGPARLQNQCNFLRGFKLTVREGPMVALKGHTKVSSILNAQPSSLFTGGKGNYIPFRNGEKRSGSGRSFRNTSGGGHQTMLSPPGSPEAETGREISDDDVMLESFPGATEVYHPLNIISKYMLACSPEAEATVTHEMDWWTLWDDDNTLPINAVLIDRLQSHYELSTELECAFLIRKDSRQLGRGGGSSTSVTLPFAIQPHPRPLQKTPTNDAPHRSTHVTLSRQNDRSARTPAAHRGSDLTKMQMKSDSLEAIDDPESLKTFDSFMEPSDLYHSTTDNIADGVPSRCSSGQSSASYSTSESDSSSQIPSLFDSPESPESLPSNVSISSAGGAPNNKNKLYQCLVCSKSFPRRSGLETHMNSHTGARPYKCPLPGCDKAFAVRSNAKRHYKTHGFPPSAAESLEPQSTFSVSFDTPRVIYNDEPRGDFPELKWVQPTQTTRMSIDEPDSPSGSDEINSRPVPPSPLSAVYPPGPSSGSWS